MCIVHFWVFTVPSIGIFIVFFLSLWFQMQFGAVFIRVEWRWVIWNCSSKTFPRTQFSSFFTWHGSLRPFFCMRRDGRTKRMNKTKRNNNKNVTYYVYINGQNGHFWLFYGLAVGNFNIFVIFEASKNGFDEKQNNSSRRWKFSM